MRTKIQQRFVKENTDFSSMRPDDRLIRIWSWLVDAGINLKNSRPMYKLREQQNEELEAMEDYLEQVRELSEKRTVDIENEKMQDQLSHILSVVSSIIMFRRIDDDAGDTISDKIDQLCSKYVKLTKKVQALNKLKLNNTRSEDTFAEMISFATEKETLKREVAEPNERLQLLQRSTREFELDNTEKLAFKIPDTNVIFLRGRPSYVILEK